MGIEVIRRNSTALLVIDVQQDLFHKRICIYNAERLIENINLLAKRAHAVGASVIFIQHSGDPSMPEGMPGWQLHPAILPQAGDTRIIKHQDNAFEGTTLDAILKAKAIDCLVITGLLTHACVKATCQGARQLGYEVVLVKDGHSNYSKDAARIIEKWNGKLAEIGCEVTRAGEIAFSSQDKKHSEDN